MRDTPTEEEWRDVGPSCLRKKRKARGRTGVSAGVVRDGRTQAGANLPQSIPPIQDVLQRPSGALCSKDRVPRGPFFTKTDALDGLQVESKTARCSADVLDRLVHGCLSTPGLACACNAGSGLVSLPIYLPRRRRNSIDRAREAADVGNSMSALSISSISKTGARAPSNAYQSFRSIVVGVSWKRSPAGRSTQGENPQCIRKGLACRLS